MRFKIFFIIIVLTSDFAFSQQTPVQTDSNHLYENIESYSKYNKFTKFLYGLIFKPVVTVSPKKTVKKKAYKKLIQKPYSAFEGKTIRHIYIETLDPFGYSIADTHAVTLNIFFEKANKSHIKSQVITIRNLLLIKQNQIFDSLLVKESERLVRSRRYVQDVSFFVKTISRNSDSVDIYIRELDKWSIIPQISASPANITFKLADNNFMGSGHEFKNALTWYHTTGNAAYNINYLIPNIRNTYINTTLHYGADEFGNFTKIIAIDRSFFSPFAKWAAGINFSQQFRRDSIRINDTLSIQQRFKFNVQDYWAGHAIQIFKGNTENNRATNFISAVRFMRIRYLEMPIEALDPIYFYSNENFYMASIGISTRKYVQDKYIFKYGLTEDVPIGKVYCLTSGYQIKHNAGRLYMGARVAYGNYYSWGYLSFNIEYGTFVRASHAQQGTILMNVNYFTGLIEIGKWKIRQFVKPQVILGINRFSNDSITLNDGHGLDGFNSPVLSGTKRVVFTLQTQAYAPWNLIGFRFGPYLMYSIGMLGDAVTGFKNSHLYSQIGLGVLIKNENLILNSFQISIAFYPVIPGKGQNIFKANSFRTTDFGFRDFEIGKPATVVYQ